MNYPCVSDLLSSIKIILQISSLRRMKNDII